MTQNQLKYWEIRWKQHYENAQLKIDQAKLQLEINKLYEQIRHNKASEKIETQRLVNDRIKLSQDWQKIQNDYRAKIVELGINAAKVQSEWQTKMRSLDQKDRELQQKDVELAQKAEQILINKMTVVGDIIVSLKENQDKDERERMKILADAVGPIGKTLGLGLFGVLNAKIESNLKSSEYSEFLNSLQASYPEVFNMVQDKSKPAIKAKEYQEMYGPQAPGKLEEDIRTYLNTNDPKPVSDRDNAVSGFSQNSNGTSVIQNSGSDSNYYDNHRSAGSTKSVIQTNTSNGTSVIYSGGSHYGPGYQ